jgi:ssDNA-binding Zn-finger/Zn-ribbon topoisomerase 1
MFVVAEKPEEKCPKCGSMKVEKVISNSHIRMGKSALVTTPDPEPPLQRQKKMGKKDGYDGGFEDIPQMEDRNMIMNKDRNGNYIWKEKARTTFCS